MPTRADDAVKNDLRSYLQEGREALLWKLEGVRHAGHADLVRELIDGSVGLRAAAPDLPRHDEAWWDDYRDRLEDASHQAR